MKAADTLLNAVRQTMKDATDDSEKLTIALRAIQIGNKQIEDSNANLGKLLKAMGIDIETAGELKSALEDIFVPPSTVAKNAAALGDLDSELNDATNAANELADAMQRVATSSIIPRGPGGRFLPGQWQTNEMSVGMKAVSGGNIPRGPGGQFLPGAWGTSGGELAPYMSQRDYLTWLLGGTVGRPVKTTLGQYPQSNVFPAGDVTGAIRYLKGHGYTVGPEGDFIRPSDIIGSLGWQGGWSRMWGMGGRWGGWIPPHARLGTPLALAGLGADRMIASALGIGGSFLGGILGGGILAGGALGTMAVGAGTNLAGIGQAAGDIRTVNTDLTNLNSAIAQYGKNSIQAAQAQAQLNYDLKSFSPLARNSVLAAAQTAQGFHAMFNKLTGAAENVGAQIINQAMKVGEKFLPTIGKFAAQNMHILQVHLQPMFKWLANPSFQGPGRGGGLGIFTNLEEIFQKHFPTAIHAGEQGFELLIKTVDIAAQHLGHFLSIVNNFLTKMNNSDFGAWQHGVEKLIGLFHAWFGMFASLGKLIFDLFKPAVGLGKAFADLLSGIFRQIDGWVKANNQKGGLLNQLFSAHLFQMITALGGLFKALLPLIEQFLTVFIHVEIIFTYTLGAMIDGLKKIVQGFNWLNNALGGIPGKILAVVAVWFLFARINSVLLTGLALVAGRIPFIGTALAAVVTVVRDGVMAMLAGFRTLVVAGVNRLLLAMGLIGPTAVEQAAIVDEAMASEAMAAEEAAASMAAVETAGVAGFAALGAAALAAVPEILAVVAALVAAYEIYKHFHQITKAIGVAFSGGGGANPNRATLGGQQYVKIHGKWMRISGYKSIGRGPPVPEYTPATPAEATQLNIETGTDRSRNELLRVEGQLAARRRRRAEAEADQDAHQRQMINFYKQFGIPYKMVNGVPRPSSFNASTAGQLPPNYLAKQQQESSQAQIDMSNNQNKAAIKLLNLEKKQLEALLSMTKSQAKRTAILNQLASVAQALSTARGTNARNLGGLNTTANSYTLPLALQELIARADALAALNPNLQGPTSLQYKLALRAKAAAMKVIDSHNATMQQLIDAWNVVGQMNAIIAQRMGVFANTYHKQSTDAVTDAVKGLSAVQEMQLRELMAQRDAHRGYAPNQSAVGGGGSTTASRHGRHPHHGRHTQGTGSYRYTGPGGGHPSGTVINIDKVDIHGVQNVRQLASEIDKLARQKYQRAGGRR